MGKVGKADKALTPVMGKAGKADKALTPQDREISKLVARFTSLIARGGDAIADALRACREAGLKGVRSKHCPADWSQRGKEHFVWQAHLYGGDAEASPPILPIPEELFETWIRTKRGSPNFSLNAVRKEAQKYRKRQRRNALSAQVIETAGIEFYQADIRTVDRLRLGQPVAVITDPPYEKVGIPLWGALVRFADRVLPERGWLIAMSGQRWLPETLAECSRACAETSMQYVWTMAVHTPGAQTSSAWIGERNALCTEWKPVFVFSKGEPAWWPGVGDYTSDDPQPPKGLRDFIVSDANDKTYHKWGQSLNVFVRLVESFVAPGSLVVDPFLGGGTTGVAAYELGRAFEGFDIDEDCVKESRVRLHERNKEKAAEDGKAA